MLDEPDRHQCLRHYRPARAEFRARSHEAAHSDDGSRVPELPPCDHPLVAKDQAQLIHSETALGELIRHLRATGTFAYDSEFIGELSYIPKLCLIQVATSQRVALIDPMAGLDLTPFWQLICDNAIEKIVHAGVQDLEPAVRHTGRPPANIFDVQIAAGFIALPYPLALARLIKETTGVPLEKGLTFTHWGQRPLSSLQLRYAADDVRYLPAARAEIAKRLETLGHGAWAAEESATLCDIEQYRFDPQQQFRRIRGAAALAPQRQTILRQLLAWRDGAASAHDVPPRSFIKDQVLFELARHPVATIEELHRIKGLPRPVERAHGQEIVEAVARGMAAPLPEPSAPEYFEELLPDRFNADTLWAAVQGISAELSIDPALVATRQDIAQFRRSLATRRDPGDSRLLKGWRRLAIRQLLLDLFNNFDKVEIPMKDLSPRVAPAPRRLP